MFSWNLTVSFTAGLLRKWFGFSAPDSSGFGSNVGTFMVNLGSQNLFSVCVNMYQMINNGSICNLPHRLNQHLADCSSWRPNRQPCNVQDYNVPLAANAECDFNFILLCDIFLGGGAGGCNNILSLRCHRSSSGNTLHATLYTSVVLR
jgi:hypothetical protein